MIKAISFDGNGVLYYRDTDITDSLPEYIRDKYLKGVAIQEGKQKLRELMDMSFSNEISKRQSIEMFLDYAGITDPEQREDVKTKEMEQSRTIKLYPTEREAILELNKRGIKMGMITNTFQSAEEKAEWFRRIGLGCVVEEVVSSIDIGIAKPNPGIYEEYIKRVGFKPSEVIYVAHDEAELIGAHKAGMVTVSFNYSGEFKADYDIPLFKDILDITDLYCKSCE